MSDEPQAAQMGPYMVELEAGKRYFFCTCGKSSSQPFCDGSHKGTSLQPLAFTPGEGGLFNLCGCKQTDTPPFCDGSHNLF